MTDNELASLRERAEREALIDAELFGLPMTKVENFGRKTMLEVLDYIDKLHGLLSDMERDGGVEAGRRAERERVLGVLNDMLSVRREAIATVALSLAREAVKGLGPAEALPGDEARAEVARLKEKFLEIKNIAKGTGGTWWHKTANDLLVIAREALGEKS